MKDYRKEILEFLTKQHGNGHYGCSISESEVDDYLALISKARKDLVEEIYKELYDKNIFEKFYGERYVSATKLVRILGSLKGENTIGTDIDVGTRKNAGSKKGDMSMAEADILGKAIAVTMPLGGKRKR